MRWTDGTRAVTGTRQKDADEHGIPYGSARPPAQHSHTRLRAPQSSRTADPIRGVNERGECSSSPRLRNESNALSWSPSKSDAANGSRRSAIHSRAWHMKRARATALAEPTFELPNPSIEALTGKRPGAITSSWPVLRPTVYAARLRSRIGLAAPKSFRLPPPEVMTNEVRIERFSADADLALIATGYELGTYPTWLAGCGTSPILVTLQREQGAPAYLISHEALELIPRPVGCECACRSIGPSHDSDPPVADPPAKCDEDVGVRDEIPAFCTAGSGLLQERAHCIPSTRRVQAAK